jgi:hypothetical protein
VLFLLHPRLTPQQPHGDDTTTTRFPMESLVQLPRHVVQLDPGVKQVEGSWYIKEYIKNKQSDNQQI